MQGFWQAPLPVAAPSPEPVPEVGSQESNSPIANVPNTNVPIPVSPVPILKSGRAPIQGNLWPPAGQADLALTVTPLEFLREESPKREPLNEADSTAMTESSNVLDAAGVRGDWLVGASSGLFLAIGLIQALRRLKQNRRALARRFVRIS